MNQVSTVANAHKLENKIKGSGGLTSAISSLKIVIKRDEKLHIPIAEEQNRIGKTSLVQV